MIKLNCVRDSVSNSLRKGTWYSIYCSFHNSVHKCIINEATMYVEYEFAHKSVRLSVKKKLGLE